MAKKLSAVKIKYPNNTYSEQIPISVLLQNVKYDQTHSLNDVIGAVDLQNKGSIQQQLNTISSESGFVINDDGGVSFVGGNTAVDNWLNQYAGTLIGFLINDDGMVASNASVSTITTVQSGSIGDSQLAASLKTHLVNEGVTTTNRPTSGNYVGRMIYDKTLNKPLWCKTVSPLKWVDATGTQV